MKIIIRETNCTRHEDSILKDLGKKAGILGHSMTEMKASNLIYEKHFFEKYLILKM